MAITTIEGYIPLNVSRIGFGSDGSIIAYQPTAPGGLIVLAPAGTVSLAPVISAAPVISGTPAVGQTLTVSNGTWFNTPTSFTYAWFINGVLKSGATTSTYVPANPDKNDMIMAEVTASNANGSETAESPAVGPVS